MKKYYYFAIFCLPMVLGSCATTSKMSLSVKEPAIVTLGNHINKIGIIDRSKVAASNQTIDQFDRILTLEGKKLDSIGRTEQINSIRQSVLQNKSIDTVVVIEDDQYLNQNPTGFGVSLDQTSVQAICAKYDVEALISLEYFDTDAKASFNVRNYQANGPLGIKVPMVEQVVTIRTNVKSGWRMYDPDYVQVIDQTHFNIPLVSTGRGISPLVAFNTVKNRTSAVQQECRKIANTESKRIIPVWVRVSRDYYVGGSQRFKAGQRMAQTGNWDGAREQWKAELTNPKEKLAGQAHYNMAISSEINGFLDDAIDYASKGYELYNNRLCLNYVKILRARKQRIQRSENLK